MDAATREFHALGVGVLRAAIERADELETALLARSRELEVAGYHAQVLVTPAHSLLFLIDAETGARLPLRRTPEGEWKAGAHVYSSRDLLKILAAAPERSRQWAFLAARQTNQSGRKFFQILDRCRAFGLRRLAHLEARNQLAQILVANL